MFGGVLKVIGSTLGAVFGGPLGAALGGGLGSLLGGGNRKDIFGTALFSGLGSYIGGSLGSSLGKGAGGILGGGGILGKLGAATLGESLGRVLGASFGAHFSSPQQKQPPAASGWDMKDISISSTTAKAHKDVEDAFDKQNSGQGMGSATNPYYNRSQTEGFRRSRTAGAFDIPNFTMPKGTGPRAFEPARRRRFSR